MEKIKVLLIDDEAGFVELLAKRLASRGFDVGYVFNGEEALQKLETNSYDVVVIDMKMPGMNGIDTLKIIKKRHADIEAVILTGHPSLDLAVESLKSDAFDYLEKPVQLDSLVTVLKNAYNKKSLSGKASGATGMENGKD